MNRSERKKLRRKKHQEQNGRCHYCDAEMTEFEATPKSCTLDHVIPLHLGGQDCEGNMVAACKACNEDKGHLSPRAYRRLLNQRASMRAFAARLNEFGY